jgi:hypothetical protein
MKRKVDFNQRNVQKIFKKIIKPLKNAKPFFDMLEVKQHQWAMLTFKLQGARDGNQPWERFSKLTLYPHWKAKVSDYPEDKGYRYNPEKANIRRGTGNSKTLRYYPGNMLLQAAGGFKRSFGTLKKTNKELQYGTNHVLATKIMSTGGGRPVLFTSRNDTEQTERLFKKYIRDALKK